MSKSNLNNRGDDRVPDNIKRMLFESLRSYEERIKSLREELDNEKEYRQNIESWADSVKRDLDKLKAWVNELKEPPAHGYIVVRPREKDAVVYGYRGLETVSYGNLGEEDIKSLKAGQRVFVGTIPTSMKDPSSGKQLIDPVTGQAIVKQVPGITEVWSGEEAPLVRGKILAIEPGEKLGFPDEDLVILTVDDHRTISKRLPKKMLKELGVKPNSVIDCIPETLDIKRVGQEVETARYEVIERPKVSFDDIGGLKDVKQELVRSIINPMLNPDDYNRYKKTGRRILLNGPPGCGKTMLAQALASSLKNCGFYRVNAGEIYHWLLGSSAANLRNIFNIAVGKIKDGEFDNMIVFLDEIDALAPHRGMHPGASGAEERVVGQLLAILDGFDKLPSGLTVIGATNLPIMVDSAVRQRFDKIISVPQPSDPNTVRDIASKYISPDRIPMDKYLIQKEGSPENAALKLLDELTEFMMRDEEIPTRFGKPMKKKDIITGRLISQMVEYAKDRALDDRTIFRLATRKIQREDAVNLKSLLDVTRAEERAEQMRERYLSPEEIGVNLEYLKEGFEKHKVERAEEMISSAYRYQLEEPRVPELRTYS